MKSESFKHQGSAKSCTIIQATSKIVCESTRQRIEREAMERLTRIHNNRIRYFDGIFTKLMNEGAFNQADSIDHNMQKFREAINRVMITEKDIYGQPQTK